jgi:hypothetical protein
MKTMSDKALNYEKHLSKIDALYKAISAIQDLIDKAEVETGHFMDHFNEAE